MENRDEIINELIELSNTFVNEIVALKTENEKLKADNEAIFANLKSIIDMQKNLTDTISKNQMEVKILGETMTRSVSNVAYEIGSKNLNVPNVASVDETVDKIINEKASICRYGDGEFSIMMGCSRQGFQHQDELLRQKLIEVFESQDNGNLIAIADNYASLENYSDSSKDQIRYYMTDEVREGHAKFFQQGRTYYNAYLTMPYLLYRDKDTDGPKKRFDKIKKIWDKRDIIIIEGELTRFGVGNDLLDNAKSIKRILCPPKHAFDKYQNILNIALEEGVKSDDNVLFLISLGPTATVLAYDIFKNGYQAVDIGHLDNNYENFIRGNLESMPIAGKHVNNVTSTEEIEDVRDENYLNQIVNNIR